LEARNIDRPWGILIIYSGLAIFLVIAFFTLIPIAVKEILTIKVELEAQQPTQLVEKLEGMIREKLTFVDTSQLNLAGKAKAFVADITKTIFDTMLNVVNLVSTLVIVPFATFFFLKDGRHLKKAIIEKVPNRYFEMSLNLIDKIDGQLGGYIRGQMIDAAIVGILSIIGLWILGVPYFVIIGVFGGLGNLIPYLGPLVGMVPAILVQLIATNGNINSIIPIPILFGAIQLFDEVLISPLVVAKSIDMHPLMIIIAILIGGHVLGVVGMLISVPIAGILKVTFSEIYTAVKKFHLV
jgi:predicted PurR-regulated permease PerM